MRVRNFGVLFLLNVLLLSGICLAENVDDKSAPEITIKEWITDSPPEIGKPAHRVRVIEFWATWCHPCIKNIPHLIALNNKYQPKGVEFIALSQDKSADKVRDIVRSKGINYHVAIDNGTVDWFGVSCYPTVVVINHLGKVVWQGLPWDSGFEKAIAKAVIAGPPPILAGVDLGPFEYLKKSLFGGKNFAESYYKIKTCVNDPGNPKKSAAAKKIVDTINQRIYEKTQKADHFRTTDPARACSLYAELISKYDGIEVIKPAKATYIKMKKQQYRSTPLLSSLKK